MVTLVLLPLVVIGGWSIRSGHSHGVDYDEIGQLRSLRRLRSLETRERNMNTSVRSSDRSLASEEEDASVSQSNLLYDKSGPEYYSKEHRDAFGEMFARLFDSRAAGMSLVPAPSALARETAPPTASLTTPLPTSTPTTDEPTQVPTAPPTSSAPTGIPTALPTSVSPTSPPSSSPTLPCDMTPELRSEAIFFILLSVSPPVLLSDNRTPQGKAFDWIVSEDAYYACPSDERCSLIQRYILAVVYFSSGGNNWFQCSADTTSGDDCGNEFPFVGDTRFLDSASECEWAGITCSNNGCVTEIEFGEYLIFLIKRNSIYFSIDFTLIASFFISPVPYVYVKS